MNKKAAKEITGQDITDMVIRAAVNVYNALGAGFLEQVYENALAIELTNQGLQVFQQYPMTVYYKGKPVGDYYADLLLEDQIIIELKVAAEISKSHEVQLLNYLRATGKDVGLLFNFGDKLEFKRKVLPRAHYDSLA